ncbi:signal recognition particle-docking protein FtsY [Psychromonas sp. SP041]|uniref:signal recognition particle-docking protein FtsY n=1 Tax=Psychromonas sp. SP041 TaxID=1365007 RepID=UPI0010C778B7|nr:signal recognition particle-docking protein FtsY [Psychromonas sp. SP041]
MSKKKGLFSWFSKKPAKETEQEKAELLVREQAEKEAALEKVAAEEAQKQAELEAREQAEIAAREKAAAEEAQKQAELEAREQAELAAREIAAAEEAQKQAELEAREQAEIAEREKAAAEEAQKQAEIFAREQAELAAQEQAAEEAKQVAALLAKEQAELAAQEKAAVEEAQKQADLLARQQAELEAQEQAAKARAAYQEAQRNAEIARQQVEQDLNEEVKAEIELTPAVVEEPEKTEESLETDETKKLGFFARFAHSLKRTRLSIGSGLLSLFKGKKIDDDLFEELEEQLIVADIGVETTLRIIQNLTDHADRKQLKDAEVLYELLKKDLSDILEKVEQPLVIDETKKPYVILMVGVNGVGKTTTIGKLAKKYQSEGKSVMLAAGDTFRAAAVEQLQVWGDRNNIPVIAQQTGADSASVLFDAMDAAQARGADVLIADTAGRLQNKEHLMGELAKVVRIMRKKDATAPHEIMLTIDAGTGQNAISQVKLFNEAVGLTGVTFTKLDGTAKGGIIFSIADQFKLPIRYIGVGEGIDDLREFNAKEFIDALFSKEDES